jgi:RNA polymerase sigma-70 factor (ECF subfamily)
VGQVDEMGEAEGQDGQYALAARAYGAALQRLARAYEADADLRHDLLQDIHLALWRSFAGFDGRCAVRTWVYRVAHNVGASHILKQRARSAPLTTLEDYDPADEGATPEEATGERRAMARLMALIHALKPPDRQVMLLYLEDLDAAAIGEVTGLSSGAVANRIHRTKAILARDFHQQRGRDD